MLYHIYHIIHIIVSVSYFLYIYMNLLGYIKYKPWFNTPLLFISAKGTLAQSTKLIICQFKTIYNCAI